jgi:hypothetical protein
LEAFSNFNFKLIATVIFLNGFKAIFEAISAKAQGNHYGLNKEFKSRLLPKNCIQFNAEGSFHQKNKYTI